MNCKVTFFFSRFEDSKIVKFQTIANALGSDSVDIVLPAQSTNEIYLWHHHTLEVSFRMVDDVGKALPDTAMCAPPNNVRINEA